MSEHFRVIADRNKGDDPVMGDIRNGDRYTCVNTPGTVEVVRIERPVPTTDEPEDETQDLRTQVANLVPLSMVDSRDHRGNVFEVADEIIPVVLASVTPSLPTREQIAEAQQALTELGDAIALPDTQAGEDWFTERMGLATDIFESVLALLQKRADR